MPRRASQTPAGAASYAAIAYAAIAMMLLGLPPAARGEEKAAEEVSSAQYVRSHYTKFEYRIPMRDGVRLFTAVYLPNDVSQTWPILLFRTPYDVDPYGADQYMEELGPVEAYQEEGFIFVYQDVRGRFMSEGEFVNMRPHVADKKGPSDVDESTDTYDTIEWLLENLPRHQGEPRHNGKVGQWGVSYPGFYTSAGIIDSHPALVAASPQAPIADWWWDDMHHHGAFILPLAFNFFSVFGLARDGLIDEWPDGFVHGTPDGYGFFLDLGPLKNVNEKYFHGEIVFWNEIVSHPNYDAFWQSRNILPHLKNIGAAVMVVGGWYDTEDLYGPLHTYRAIEEQNPDAWNMLVMGPWRHGGWRSTDGDVLGTAEFGFKTSKFYQEEVELPFFRHFLKGEGELHLPEALMFETGANRWRRFDAWPPTGLRQAKLHFGAGGTLGWEPAGAGSDEAFDEYPSDPHKPVPYTMEITSEWAKDYMTEDQRFAAWRPDVLVYESAPLEQDLTLAGPLEADLWVSTTGSAADFIVKVIDVHPEEEPGYRPEEDDDDEDEENEEVDRGGFQRLVRAEVFRGRFRNGYEKPEPFVPGEITHLEFALHDVLHTWKRGHRVMVQVQSTWFPFVDRNPQKFVPNIFAAQEEDFIKATHRVYRSAEHPSGVKVEILPRADE